MPGRRGEEAVAGQVAERQEVRGDVDIPCGCGASMRRFASTVSSKTPASRVGKRYGSARSVRPASPPARREPPRAAPDDGARTVEPGRRTGAGAREHRARDVGDENDLGHVRAVCRSVVVHTGRAAATPTRRQASTGGAAARVARRPGAGSSPSASATRRWRANASASARAGRARAHTRVGPTETAATESASAISTPTPVSPAPAPANAWP